MDKLKCWISRVIWGGIFVNMLFVLPMVLAPGWLLDLLSIKLDRLIWAQANGMLLFIISVFYIPAALDPVRYRVNVWLHSGLSRFCGATFFTINVFFLGVEIGYISIAIVDAIFGSIVMILLLKLRGLEKQQGLHQDTSSLPPAKGSTGLKSKIQRVIWLGIFINMLFVIPLFFAPQWIVDFFNLKLERLIWAQAGGMLLFIISMFYVPGAIDIDRYRVSAWFQCMPSRAFGASFFAFNVIFLGAEPGFLAIAAVDAVFGLTVLLLLLRLAKQEKYDPDVVTEADLIRTAPIKTVVSMPSRAEDDADASVRQAQLNKSRQEYQFNYEHLPPIPYLDKVPKHEQFSLEYWAKRLWSARPLVGNQILAYVRYFATRPLNALADYRHLFTVYKGPFSMDSYLIDEAFNEQRITGCNPQALELLDELKDDFPFSDAHIQQKLGSDFTIKAEMARKRLYYVDFHQIAHVKGGVWKGLKKNMPAPRSLFWWDAEKEVLQCIGIAVKRTADARVFLPSDPPLDWLAAKIAYQCADVNHQELGTHFTNCHATMAPFAIVTNRQLALKHPVHILLKPHFLYYLYDNELGRATFVNPGGPVDRMMGGTLTESLGVAANFYTAWSLLEFSHPKELARRKLDNPNEMTRYPFRDDGMLLWDAVVEFVDNYIALYYHQDSDVANDSELQAWAAELVSQQGGRVAGMPERLSSIASLNEVLSIVIWTCGPLHSMLNFSQWDFNFAPNMPYATYADIPEQVGAVDQATIMRIMPPFKEAANQLLWNVFLTSYQHNPLGQYPGNYQDPKAKDVVEVFQQKLIFIEKQINEREEARKHSFPYFKPSRAINSINT